MPQKREEVNTHCGMKKQFITFITHGSRQEGANRFLNDLISEVAGGNAVNLGFLGPGPPSIPEALEAHIRNGAREIRIVPLFLIPGKHLAHDIPAEIARVKANHPSVNLNMGEFIGNSTAFRKVLADSIRGEMDGRV